MYTCQNAILLEITCHSSNNIHVFRYKRPHRYRSVILYNISRYRISLSYYINITFPERVLVENIIPRNVIINRGAAEVHNHISRDDIFDYHPSGNVIFILLYRTEHSRSFIFYRLFSLRLTMVRGVPKGMHE